MWCTRIYSRTGAHPARLPEALMSHIRQAGHDPDKKIQYSLPTHLLLPCLFRLSTYSLDI